MKKKETAQCRSRIGFALMLLAIGCVISGNKACREDYDLGSRSSLLGTPTATPNPDDGGDDATVTLTVTPTGSVNPTLTLTPTPTVTATGSVTETPVTQTTPPVLRPTQAPLTLSALRGSLERIADEASGDFKAQLAANDFTDGNWLGSAFATSEKSDLWQDSDRDGYSDALEQAVGSDSMDDQSVPSLPASRLEARMQPWDRDWDGLEDVLEEGSGVAANVADFDGDGCRDGVELLVGSDPTNAQIRPLDRDGDCLSDEFEAQLGWRTDLADSDGDGLSDDLEVVFATDGLSMDSDGDGIADGKEVQLGSDPLVTDFIVVD